MEGKEKCKSQKQNIAVTIILGILFVAIFIGIYKNSNTHIQNDSEVENIDVITNMDERLSIDLSEYGKETPEDVFVEFIQAICDDDPERKEESSAVQVYKIDERWYVNIYSI